jgi:hypothetical protein
MWGLQVPALSELGLSGSRAKDQEGLCEPV